MMDALHRYAAGSILEAHPEATVKVADMALQKLEADSPETQRGDHVERESRRRRWVDNYLWLALGMAALVGLGIIWKFLPHERENVTLWQFAVKVLAFVIAVLAVSFIPRFERVGFLIASLPYFAFLGFITPKMTYYFLKGPQTQPEYYTYLWSLSYPAIILSICLSWRQAGGSVGRSIKIGLNGLLLVFSGFLEWMWFRINTSMNYYDMKTIPHIDVIIGHFPSYGGLFVYMLCNVPLFVAVNMAPIDSWVDRLRGSAAAPEADAPTVQATPTA